MLQFFQQASQQQDKVKQPVHLLKRLPHTHKNSFHKNTLIRQSEAAKTVIQHKKCGLLPSCSSKLLSFVLQAGKFLTLSLCLQSFNSQLGLPIQALQGIFQEKLAKNQKRYFRQDSVPHLHSIRIRFFGEPARLPTRPKFESILVLSAFTGSTVEDIYLASNFIKDISTFDNKLICSLTKLEIMFL